MIVENNILRDIPKMKKIKCNLCNKVFKSKSGFESHYKKCSRENLGKFVWDNCIKDWFVK